MINLNKVYEKIDATLTVDNRWFKGEGRSDILDTTVNILDNIKGAASNFANDVVDIYNNPLKIVRDLGDALNESINDFAKTLNINANNSDEYQDELIEKLKETEEQLKDKNLSEQQKMKLTEEIEQISSLVIQIETGTIECSKGNCTPKLTNLDYNYAVDSNGKIFLPPISCLDDGSLCAYVGGICNNKDNCSREWLEPSVLQKKYPNMDIQLDKNGKILTSKSVAYIPTGDDTGYLDVISIGNYHWSAKKGKNGGGLDDLLEFSKDYYPEFYDAYLKRVGYYVDATGNKIPYTKNSDIVNDLDKMSNLVTLMDDFKNDENFKIMENKAAIELYLNKPFINTKVVHDKLNNFSIKGKSYMLSTCVNIGCNSTQSKYNAIVNIFKTNSSEEDIIKAISDYKKERYPHLLNRFEQEDKFMKLGG